MTSGPVYTDKYEWDGREQLRKIVRSGTPDTVLYTAQYDADGDRVQGMLNGVSHQYSYALGALPHDRDGGTHYTSGVGQRRSSANSTL